ncbi:MAG: serine protease [Thermoguttaceae bacterium]|nr:serine protease [Thermoguttaceae bacterium]
MKFYFDSKLPAELRIIPLVTLLIFLLDTFSFGILCPGTLFAQTSDSLGFRSRSNVRSVSPQMPSVQQTYPAFGKIVGRAEEALDKVNHTQTLYYGSGVYVAELNDFGIVLTNWHVVSDAKGSILVKFPNYESDGVVILADQVWDLAAIVIRKPPFLPVPISLEVPQIDERLWVGGYGQYPELNGFKFQPAKVTRYMVLATQHGLPAETLALDAGVRQGDSGGPILNRYGELSGLIWGSDGKVTMGTFSLRLQAFLTQAQFQLFNQPELGTDFVKLSMKQYPPKMIQMAATTAQTALQACGIFPISSKPVYVLRQAHTAGGRASGAIPHTSAEEAFGDMPPYPPIESPTLIAQRSVIGRDHPEVYPASMLKTGPSGTGAAKSGDRATVGTAKSKGMPLHNVSLTTSSGEAAAPSSSAADTSKTADMSDNSIALPPESAKTTGNGNNNTSSENQGTFSLSDVRIIVVILILFFFFFNAVRLLAIAHEK